MIDASKQTGQDVAALHLQAMNASRKELQSGMEDNSAPKSYSSQAIQRKSSSSDTLSSRQFEGYN